MCTVKHGSCPFRGTPTPRSRGTAPSPGPFRYGLARASVSQWLFPVGCSEPRQGRHQVGCHSHTRGAAPTGHASQPGVVQGDGVPNALQQEDGQTEADPDNGTLQSSGKHSTTFTQNTDDSTQRQTQKSQTGGFRF